MLFLSLSIFGILSQTQTDTHSISLSLSQNAGLLKILTFIWEINEYIIWILNLCFIYSVHMHMNVFGYLIK
jgi:hypothetical protein